MLLLITLLPTKLPRSRCWLTTPFHGGWPSTAAARALHLQLALLPRVVLVGICRGTQNTQMDTNTVPRQIPDLLGAVHTLYVAQLPVLPAPLLLA